jgi:hypothetical protein
VRRGKARPHLGPFSRSALARRPRQLHRCGCGLSPPSECQLSLGLTLAHAGSATAELGGRTAENNRESVPKKDPWVTPPRALPDSRHDSPLGGRVPATCARTHPHDVGGGRTRLFRVTGGRWRRYLAGSRVRGTGAYLRESGGWCAPSLCCRRRCVSSPPSSNNVTMLGLAPFKHYYARQPCGRGSGTDILPERCQCTASNRRDGFICTAHA